MHHQSVAVLLGLCIAAVACGEAGRRDAGGGDRPGIPG